MQTQVPAISFCRPANVDIFRSLYGDSFYANFNLNIGQKKNLMLTFLGFNCPLKCCDTFGVESIGTISDGRWQVASRALYAT